MLESYYNLNDETTIICVDVSPLTCFLQELFYGIQTCLVLLMSVYGENQGMNGIPQKLEMGQPAF